MTLMMPKLMVPTLPTLYWYTRTLQSIWRYKKKRKLKEILLFLDLESNAKLVHALGWFLPEGCSPEHSPEVSSPDHAGCAELLLVSIHWRVGLAISSVSLALPEYHRASDCWCRTQHWIAQSPLELDGTDAGCWACPKLREREEGKFYFYYRKSLKCYSIKWISMHRVQCWLPCFKKCGNNSEDTEYNSMQNVRFLHRHSEIRYISCFMLPILWPLLEEVN